MNSPNVKVVLTEAGRFRLEGGAEPVECGAIDALAPGVPRPLQLAALQAVIGLKVREIALAASVSEQTVRNWKKSMSPDRPARYDDLRAVAERLVRAETVEPKLVGSWLRSRNRGLSYARPLEVIGAGDFASVMDVAESFIAMSPPVPESLRAEGDSDDRIPDGSRARGESTQPAGDPGS